MIGAVQRKRIAKTSFPTLRLRRAANMSRSGTPPMKLPQESMSLCGIVSSLESTDFMHGDSTINPFLSRAVTGCSETSF